MLACDQDLPFCICTPYRQYVSGIPTYFTCYPCVLPAHPTSHCKDVGGPRVDTKTTVGSLVIMMSTQDKKQNAVHGCIKTKDLLVAPCRMKPNTTLSRASVYPPILCRVGWYFGMGHQHRTSLHVRYGQQPKEQDQQFLSTGSHTSRCSILCFSGSHMQASPDAQASHSHCQPACCLQEQSGSIWGEW